MFSQNEPVTVVTSSQNYFENYLLEYVMEYTYPLANERQQVSLVSSNHFKVWIPKFYNNFDIEKNTQCVA